MVLIALKTIRPYLPLSYRSKYLQFLHKVFAQVKAIKGSILMKMQVSVKVRHLYMTISPTKHRYVMDLIDEH